MSLRNKALSGLVWAITDKLFNQLGLLGVTVYLARLLGPESFGLIGMLTIFVLLTESVISGGFNQALVQRSSQLTESDSSTIFYVNFAWGLAIYAVLYCSAPHISEFYSQPELTAISRLLFVVIIINSLSVVVRAKLTIEVDFKSLTLANTFSTVASAGVGITLSIYGYGYWALVWLHISKSIVITLALWVYCKWFPRLVFSPNSFRSMFGFGSNLMFAGLVATFVNNLYVVLIGRYFSATHVGYYTQANFMSTAASEFISSTLKGVTYPILTSVKDDRERLTRIYKQLIGVTMMVSLPILVGLSAISYDVVTIILGDEWMATVPVLAILCLARAITPISIVNMNILNAIGRSDLFLFVDLSKLPMTLGALYIALPYGIEGLAWAVLATTCISFFINAYFPGKIFGFGGFSQLRIAWKYAVASLLMYVVVKFLFDANSMALLASKIFAGMVVYVLALLVLKDELYLNTIQDLKQRISVTLNK